LSRILILNPNSSVAMTRSMVIPLQGLAMVGRHQIDAQRIESAPPGIESDADVALVAPMVVDRVQGADADGIVVACFSDPGVEMARHARPGLPLIGIAEAAYYAALPLGRKFGVVSLSVGSVARHARRIADLGLGARLAGDRAVDMGVAEASDPEHALGRVCDTAQALRDIDGAEVVILGCAGMGHHRPALEKALGIPVVDPVQAAVVAVIGQLELNYRTA